MGPQLVHTHSVGRGVMGVVEGNIRMRRNLVSLLNHINISIADWLQPTHNKQDFYLGENKAKHYELLITALGDKLKVTGKEKERKDSKLIIFLLYSNIGMI